MKKTLSTIINTLLILVIILSVNSAVYADSGIYGGGPIYKNRSYSISELKNSGFTYVVVWTIHIDASGNLNFNAEFPLVQNGSYIGASSYPNFASDIASLKVAPTSINRVEFCLAAWGSSTFANIQSLIASQGTGSSSILYRNFQALKSAFPTVDAIGFDDESTYDASSATAFAVMLGGLGFKVSLVPYTNSSFWTTVASNTNSQRPGTVDRVDLQCYSGGAGNSPCSWNFGGIKINPGLWDSEKTTSQVTSQLTSWKNQCGITGGFMWLYDDFANSSLTAQYAAAINTVFNGSGGTSAATFYKDCNYGGYAVGLPVGNYTLSQLISHGIANDDISSLTVQSGYTVTLYWDDNFGGSTLTKTANDACLVADGWNDKVSSLKIAATSARLSTVQQVVNKEINIISRQNELQFVTAEDISGIQVRVFDMAGRQLFTARPVSNRINISSLSPGIYFIVYNNNGKQFAKRFVK
jgi:hypothetical protein